MSFKLLTSKMALLLVTMLLASAPLVAQVKFGSIGGIVQDPTGAVIPGATVKATNQDTGVMRETLTSDAGVFRIANLIPGLYTVAISLSGFKTVEFTNVEVRVGVENNLGTITLEVGEVAETVTVVATAPLIETASAQISHHYDKKKLIELPISPAGVDVVALLTPGVTPGFGNVNSNGVTLSVNGNRARANNFTIDGQDNNDLSIGGPGVFIDQPDVLEEFQIITNQFNAEFGRNAGAQVNLVLKSGTNEYHGTVYEYHQNASALNALTNIQKRDGLKKPPVSINNRFGFTLGGPVIRDKFFFFSNLQFERTREQTRFESQSINGLVPTPAGIATLKRLFPNSNTVRIWETRGPLARKIGNPRIIPGTERLLTVTPQGDQAEFGFVERTIPTPFNANQVMGKLDFNLSEKTMLSARYIFQDQDFINAVGAPGSAGYRVDVPARSQTLGLTITRNFTPRSTNEFRFNYGRLGVFFSGGDTEPFGNIRENLSRMNLPAGFLDFGLQTNLPQFRMVNNYQYQDNFTVTKGKHTFKMGIDLRRILVPLGFLPFVNGQYNFPNLATWLNNQPSSVQFAAGDTVFHVKEFNQFYYIQDDWKVTPTLTLNFGLRYENVGQSANRLHELTLARESGPGAFWNPSLPLEARVVPKLERDDNNWAPRFGFAWAPRALGEGKTVIRGGYGIAYDPSFFNILLNVQTSAPFVFLFAFPIAGIPAPPVVGDGLGKDLAAAVPLPLGRFDPRTLAQTQMSNPFKNPYTQQWSFGIQRQFGANQAFEARYVGNHQVGLFQSVNANPLISTLAAEFPQFIPAGIKPAANGRVNGDFGPVRLRCNCADANYHGLQLRWDGRFGSGLIAGASYSVQKVIDNSSEIFTFFNAGSVAFSQNPFDFRKSERGTSNFDIRQVLALNYIWELPFFKEQRGFAGKLLGGWEVSGILRFNSGRPYTPLTTLAVNGFSDTAWNLTFAGLFDVLRPFLINPNAPAGTFARVSATSPTGFVDARGNPVSLNSVRYLYNNTAGSRFFGSPFGNAGRNIFRGDGFARWDFAVFKNTKVGFLGEGGYIQFRAEFQNFTNHPNFGVPDITMESLFGRFEDPTENEVFPRSIRFGLRMVF